MALGQPLVAGSWRGIEPPCYCIYNNWSKNNNKKNKSWAKPLSWHGRATPFIRSGGSPKKPSCISWSRNTPEASSPKSRLSPEPAYPSLSRKNLTRLWNAGCSPPSRNCSHRCCASSTEKIAPNRKYQTQYWQLLMKYQHDIVVRLESQI